MNEFLSIIYVSSAVNLFTDSELNELLFNAKNFNRANSLTGVLLYADGHFMQCIEGPVDSVLLAYSRICASRRHRGLIELNRSMVQDRSFESREMALLRPNKTEFVSISNALSLASQKDNSSTIAIEFMKSFISTVRAI